MPEGTATGTITGLRQGLVYDATLVSGLVGGAVRAAPGALAHGTRHPRRTLRSGLGTAASVYRTVRPINATASPIMRNRRMVRELGVHQVTRGEQH